MTARRRWLSLRGAKRRSNLICKFGFIFILVIAIIFILMGKSNTLGAGGEERIVFTVLKDANADIVCIDIDGKNLRNLTNHPAIDRSPVPSPNGKYIAFISWRNGIPQIFIMNSDGKNPKLLIDDVVLSRHTWSPGSKWVAFVEGRHRIVAVNINSGEVKEIFETPDDVGPYASWSPDGKKIAIRLLDVEPGEKGDIYTTDVDENLNGRGLRRLTKGPADDQSPSWSPDSKKITFSSDRDGGGIYIMDSDGANVTLIHKNPNGCCPSWSPDGQKIVFYSAFSIFVMDSDGSNVKQVFDGAMGGEIDAPKWLGSFFGIELEDKWKTTWGKIKGDF